MPNRVLRDGLIYSGLVNKASVDAECLFVRILLAADDFGLIEVEPVFLKARCMPARDSTIGQISAWTDELMRIGLLREYEHGGKQYAAIEKWDQRRFAKHPKYPMPPWGTDHIRGGYVDPRVATEAPRVPTVGNPEPEKKAEKKPKVNGAPHLPEWLDREQFNKWAKIRPAKARTPEALAAAVEKLGKMKEAGHDPNAIVTESLANGWQGLFEPKAGRLGAAPDYSSTIANLRD